MKIKEGQIYYNRKDVCDFLRIEKEEFPDQEHAHARHLRILGTYFLFRDKWDSEEMVPYSRIKKDYIPLLSSSVLQEVVSYAGEDKLTSDVSIYPWPKKLVDLVNKYGKIKNKKGKKK